jgi:hypothetical protein
MSAMTTSCVSPAPSEVALDLSLLPVRAEQAADAGHHDDHHDGHPHFCRPPVGVVVGFLIVGHARIFRVNGRYRIGARTDPRIETLGRCTSIGL